MNILSQQRVPISIALAMLLTGSATALVGGSPVDRSEHVAATGTQAAACSDPGSQCPRRLGLLPADPGIADAPNSFPVTGATPGGRVAYYLGRPAGISQVEIIGCPTLTLDIGLARGLGRADADSHGNATLTRAIPEIFSGLTLAAQAVDVMTCTLGNEQTASY